MSKSVNTALQRRAAEVAAGAEALMAKTRDWQLIQQYYCNRLGEEFLTDEQKKKRDRYQFVYNALVTGKYTTPQVVNQLISIYKIKSTQAYEDVKCTKELWPSFANLNRQFELQVELDINRKMLNKAAEIGDMKAYAQLEKNRIKMLQLLPEETDTPADLFEGHEIEPVFNPALIGAPTITTEDLKDLLKSINAKRSKPFNMDLFEDLDFEEVPG